MKVFVWILLIKVGKLKHSKSNEITISELAHVSQRGEDHETRKKWREAVDYRGNQSVPKVFENKIGDFHCLSNFALNL